MRIRRSPKSIAFFEGETTWTDANKPANTKNFKLLGPPHLLVVSSVNNSHQQGQTFRKL